MPKVTVDVSVQKHGTIALLVPNNQKARRWMEKRLTDAIWFGSGAACEPRYLPEVVAGMRTAGLTVE